MITRLQFKRKSETRNWWTYTGRAKDQADICGRTLNQWVGGIDKAQIMYLCFTERRHPPSYAYEYSFDADHCLVVHTKTSLRRTAPFMYEMNTLLNRLSKKGLIPRHGWGWVEYEA